MAGNSQTRRRRRYLFDSNKQQSWTIGS